MRADERARSERRHAAEDVQLRNAALVQLLGAWSRYNEDYVRSALRPPSLSLADGTARLGSWDREQRELRISERHVFEDSWTDVLATLRHEMAHQYADEVLGAHGERPHGDAFQRACALLRADPSPAARVRPGDDAEDDVLRRLRKLLALGRSPNRNEAEAALAKAQEWMDLHRLDPVEFAQGSAENGFGRLAVRAVGPIRKRHQAWRAALANLLTEHFEVSALWVHAYDPSTAVNGRVLQLYGREHHLKFAVYVHDWIAGAKGVLGRLWRADKVRRGDRSDRERARFHEGVLRGFREVLDERAATGSASAFADRPTEAAPSRTPAEISRLVAERERVRDFVHWHHPHVRTHRVGGRATGSDAFRRGRAQGRSLDVRRPLESDGGGGPRYLTG